MPRIPGTSNAQSAFLRTFRSNPAGPPPEEWPAPAVLRRWLRRPAFQDALVTLREVLRFRTEFHLTAAAAQAAQRLQSNPSQDPAVSAQDYKRLLDLLRLTHTRQRFPVKDPDLRIPSCYNSDGERIYRDDELDEETGEPYGHFPNIQPRNRRPNRVPDFPPYNAPPTPTSSPPPQRSVS
jgi:hypothetical protein